MRADGSFHMCGRMAEWALTLDMRDVMKRLSEVVFASLCLAPRRCVVEVWRSVERIAKKHDFRQRACRIELVSCSSALSALRRRGDKAWRCKAQRKACGAHAQHMRQSMPQSSPLPRRPKMHVIYDRLRGRNCRKPCGRLQACIRLGSAARGSKR